MLAMVIEAFAAIFDELADHALLAQHLGDSQHQVGRRRAFRQRAGEAEADHLGDQHRDRLAEHGRLRLDAADAPAQHGEAVDHGGVAVGADHGVGIGELIVADAGAPHRLGQVFEVHLVADAGAGRHDAEVVEGRGAPAQEAVALEVALVLLVDVAGERGRGAEIVHHHRVVDHQVDRRQRVDLGRIGAELGQGVAHGGEVDNGRHAGEVLHQHPRRAEADLMLDGPLVVDPGGEGLQVVGAHGDAVLEPQLVLQQHLQRHRQLADAGETGLFRRPQAIVMVGLAAGDQLAAGLKAVDRRHYEGPSLFKAARKSVPGSRAGTGHTAFRLAPRNAECNPRLAAAGFIDAGGTFVHARRRPAGGLAG
jgi:hypothetical protein